MSVLIQKIDMPSMCCVCPCHDYDMETNRYYCQALKDEPRIIDENTRRDDCPLVDIHTPHGRLIDASKLPIELVDEDGFCAAVCFSGYIEEAPTIIEAEE